jgi:glycosyltransferase involved in cell wall biosynthesis
MRILFASAHPYLPQLNGGSQTNTHEMAEALQMRGHEVAVLAGLTDAGWLGLRDRLWLKLSRCRAVADRGYGYPVFRSWLAWEGAGDAVAAFRPDVAIVQSGAILRVAGALRDTGVPLLIYNHNIEFDDHGDEMEEFLDECFVANSVFTAAAYRERYGVDSTVIVPLFDRTRYRVESDRTEVLFVNPHPHKGVDIALRLAHACPDIPFRFVRGWQLPADAEARLVADVAALPNVRLCESTASMAQHYHHARILLAPSRWAETWGRVATEAQFSGIPVLATRIGGLVEAVGPGGLLVDPDAAPHAWVEALRRMWDDQALYDRLSADALAYAERSQIDPARQVEAIEMLAKAAIAAG